MIQHLDDGFRRVLQVGVDDGGDVAYGFGQPRGERNLMSEIAGQGEDPHARVGALESSQEVQRGVAAAVVNVDDLEINPGGFLDDVDETAMRLGDDGFLVEAGDNDGQENEGMIFLPGGWDGVSRTFRLIAGQAHLSPTIMESGPARCSMRVSRKPTSFIQPEPSAPV